MPSIASRITLGFSALAVLFLALAAFTFSDLYYLESHFRQGSVVHRLVEAVAELREHEANLFDRGLDRDLAAGRAQAEIAATLAAEHQDQLAAVCAGRPCAQLTDDLINYQLMFDELIHVPAGELRDFETEIRVLGDRISGLTAGLAERETRFLSAALNQTSHWLLGGVLAVGLLGALLGPLVAGSVVRPLRRLETDLAPIAAGRFQRLPAPSRDREFRSLAEAFNRMLLELENRQRRLVQSEKLASLGVLVSGVAHELNNPLSNISTTSQLAQEELGDCDPAQMRAWLAQIDDQTQRAHRILQALSDYAGHRPPVRALLSLQQLLDKTLLLVRKDLGPDIRLQMEIPPNLTVLADEQRLQQVLINLLKNAVDAGGPATAITLSAEALADAQALSQSRYRLGEPPAPNVPVVRLTVADDGPGMSPEVLEHIFDPFFTTRAPGQGMGLGLYIVQEIVRDLDGVIAVDSAPGEGTRVELILPRPEAPADAR